MHVTVVMPGRMRASVLGSVIGLLFAVAGVIPANAVATEAPRWDIVAVSNPTSLQANSPRNEVQKVAVNATGGTFTLTVQINSQDNPATTAPIPYDASPEEVQSALESLNGVGAGNITVSGGPGGVNPYIVTFVGEHGNAPVLLMTTNGTSLTPGGTSGVVVTEVTKGAYPPQLVITATNVGGASSDGSAITIADVLHEASGLTPVGEIKGVDAYRNGIYVNGSGFISPSPPVCAAAPVISCEFIGTVDPGDVLTVTVTLNVSERQPGEVSNEATVSGGGAPSATASTPVAIGGPAVEFGPAPGSVTAATSTSRAGAHADLTTSFSMATQEVDKTVKDPKDIRFDVPPGLVGNTVGMPRCTMQQVLNQAEVPNTCPSDAMVGMAVVSVQQGATPFVETVVTPVWNIAPAPGEPAAFAFETVAFPVRLDTSVLSDGNYAVRVTAPDLAEAGQILSTSITVWGVPADHDGPGEDLSNYTVRIGSQSFGVANPQQTRRPLLTSPQQCSEPLMANMLTDSWENPGAFVSSGSIPVDMGSSPIGLLTGCNELSLESSFTMTPDTLVEGAPAGYAFDLNVPQDVEANGLATPNVKDVRLTLPSGTVVSPSAAWGLRACSNDQFYGAGHGPGRLTQEPASPAECPREAQVGTVRVKTPALEEALEGEVYLAEPECNPCTPEDAQDGKMVRLFLQVVSEGEGGIVVKLEGHGSINQQTGQITTTFENNPQLPFSSLKLNLDGGPRAVLANPRTCGSAASNLDLTPWSTPFSADSTSSSEFEVNQDCFGPQFNPSFTAGLTNLQAGEYGPFTLSFGRGDDDQFLGGLELHMPPGLSGSIAHVPLCQEPQASQGTCGPQSLIGHTQVLTGPGANPFLVQGGQVFLTEGYKGAPYGLSIVVPATAGPYTLSGTTGHGTVVVRATINVDPHTAALTIKSDPLPTVLDGIPLQLKVVNVTIERPEFTFGPTSCSKQQVKGTLSSTEGMSASVSSPFQVTNCARLGFGPKFSVSTSGKTSKANGASLNVKLVYPKAPWGTQANIAKVKVDLPKQLPSRLTTLQKACTAAQFESNPSGCPAASIVGHATATTPILPVPLTGPAYFVSHGGEAFPSLIVVLQGYGVTVDLVGTTFISKKGITSSTFKSVPDVPVGLFELNLPQGKFSALTANGNLCQSKLAMPTAFVGQNGAEIHGSTKIAVTGCPKKKAKKGKKTSSSHHGKGKSRKKK